MRLPYIAIIAAIAAAVVVVPAISETTTLHAEEKQIVEMKAEAVVKPEGIAAEVTAAEEASYTSPIDFDALKEANEDIKAWIQIPDSKVDYPVLFDGTDDYLYQNMSQETSKAGSIYIDKYTGCAFEDTMTILYGHNMKNGSMFKDVDRFSEDAFYRAHQDVNIYLPDEEKKLRPFLVVVGKSDAALRAIQTTEDLKKFCNGKRITEGEIPEELGQATVLVTCNYTGSDYRTYVFCH